MEIIIAKRAGFCFGVKRAIDIAFKMADKKEDVYTLGPIIHNPQVIEKLKDQGVNPVEEPKKKMGAIIIRTHGIPTMKYKQLDNMGIEVIDATCPFVKKTQQYAKLLSRKGYQVIILGDKDHPEVKSIRSFAGEDSIVVSDGEIPKKTKSKIGIVVQTTQRTTSLKKLLSNIVERAKEIKVYNTICNSTALKQKETSDLAKKVDMMIVAGGKNSANTTQLASLCSSLGVKVHHIETASEIRPKWLKDVEKIGITSGASTPGWIINEIVNKINLLEKKN